MATKEQMKKKKKPEMLIKCRKAKQNTADIRTTLQRNNKNWFRKLVIVSSITTQGKKNSFTNKIHFDRHQIIFILIK